MYLWPVYIVNKIVEFEKIWDYRD